MESLRSAMKTQQRQKQKNKPVLLKKKEKKENHNEISPHSHQSSYDQNQWQN